MEQVIELLCKYNHCPPEPYNYQSHQTGDPMLSPMEQHQIDWWEEQRANKQRYLLRMSILEFFVLLVAVEGIRWIDPENTEVFEWSSFLIRFVFIVAMSIAGAYVFFWLGERHYNKLLKKDKSEQ